MYVSYHSIVYKYVYGVKRKQPEARSSCPVWGQRLGLGIAAMSKMKQLFLSLCMCVCVCVCMRVCVWMWIGLRARHAQIRHGAREPKSQSQPVRATSLSDRMLYEDSVQPNSLPCPILREQWRIQSSTQ